jgi:hypothetical protein
MSRIFDWTLLSFQPVDCRLFRSISAYSGLFAPDFAPGFAPEVIAPHQLEYSSWTPGRLVSGLQALERRRGPQNLRFVLLGIHGQRLSKRLRRPTRIPRTSEHRDFGRWRFHDARPRRSAHAGRAQHAREGRPNSPGTGFGDSGNL